MGKKRALLLALLLSITVTLTLLKIPLVSSQGLTMVSAQIAEDLPVNDLNSPLWQKSTAIDIPLSAQNVTKPILDTKIKSVTARSLHNDTQVAVMVEWVDDTRNDEAIRIQDFRDAVALQFPQVQGQPFFCMGMQGGNVNIWHWKADWQADIQNWLDMEALYPDMNVDQYPFADGDLPSPVNYTDPNYVTALAAGNLTAAPRLSPVEDLVAGGFGSLTSESPDGQNVQGFGEWVDGKWQVIFWRDLDSSEADDVKFISGQVYSIAFAAWDGANGERNGQKSTSQWVSFQLEQPAGTPAAAGNTPAEQAAGIPKELITMIIIGVELLFIAAGIFIYLRLPDK